MYTGLRDNANSIMVSAMSLHFPHLHIKQDPFRPARLFLDTEFTKFGAPGSDGVRLISLALVDEEGRRFYTECEGWSTENCNDFVLNNVISKLENTKETLDAAANRLYRFLSKYDYAVVHCDYQGDWEWLCWLMSHNTVGEQWPASLHHEPYYVDTSYWCSTARIAADAAQRKWFSVYPRHHALHDANGMRYVWQWVSDTLGGVDDPGSLDEPLRQCA